MGFHTTGQVAGLLGIPVYRLEYLLRVERLPDASIRVGGKRIWTEEQVEELRSKLGDYDRRHGRPRRGKGKDNG